MKKDRRINCIDKLQPTAKISNKSLIITGFALLFLFVHSSFLEAAEVKEKGKTVLQFDEATKIYIQKLEKRIQELEGNVNKLLNNKKEAGSKNEQKIITETERKELKDSASATASNDEWGEPVIQKKSTTGRDEEARRRLAELETWKKKQEAKAAKDDEAAKEKPKFDFSIKYKTAVNIKDNINLNNPYQLWTYDNATYIEQRFQLKLEGDYGPFTGVVLFDKGNFVFDWKEDSQGTLDRWSEFLTVNSSLVRELFVQYTGDFILKAGRQNLMTGNEGIVLEGPVDAIKLAYPFGKTPLGMVTGNLAYIALSGGFKDYTKFRASGGPPAGDRSAVLGIANKLDGWLLSFDIKPKKGLTIQPYILKVVDRGKFGDADLNLDKDFDVTTTPRDGGFEPIWSGIAVLGKSEKISYMVDLIYLTGSYTKTRDISAYAFLLKGDYHFGNIGFLNKFSAGLELGLGSGNKLSDSTGGEYNNFRGLFLCKDRRKFGNIFSEDLRAGYYLWDSSLANVTFSRVSAAFEPLKNLLTTFSVAKYWTTESVYKGRGPVPGVDWSSGTSLTTEKTKDLGWGVDLDFAFPIAKRLRGFGEAGYFIPGVVYQRANGEKADPASKFVLGAEIEF